MARNNPKKPASATVSAFTVLIGGKAYTAEAAPLTGQALIDAETQAVTAAKEAATLEGDAEKIAANVGRSHWETAHKVAKVYAGLRAAGIDDGAAYAAIASRAEKTPGFLIKAGVNKSSAQRYAAAGRALAAGILPTKTDSGTEKLKAFATRVGGVTEKAKRTANPAKAAKRAADKALVILADLRKETADSGAPKKALDLLAAFETAMKEHAKECAAVASATDAAK
jgi:hypothetical protein